MLAAQNAAYIKEEVLPVHTSVHQVVDGKQIIIFSNHDLSYTLKHALTK